MSSTVYSTILFEGSLSSSSAPVRFGIISSETTTSERRTTQDSPNPATTTTQSPDTTSETTLSSTTSTLSTSTTFRTPNSTSPKQINDSQHAHHHLSPGAQAGIAIGIILVIIIITIALISFFRNYRITMQVAARGEGSDPEKREQSRPPTPPPKDDPRLQVLLRQINRRFFSTRSTGTNSDRLRAVRRSELGIDGAMYEVENTARPHEADNIPVSYELQGDEPRRAEALERKASTRPSTRPSIRATRNRSWLHLDSESLNHCV